MLSALHNFLLRHALTRTPHRSAVRLLKSLVKCPDLYADFRKVIRVSKPLVYLDVGCHVGDTIERALDELALPVFAFEPTPDSFNSVRNRFRNNKNVKLFNIALTATSGHQHFYCNSNSQTNSLLDNDIGNSTSFPEATEHLSVVEVETRTIDSWAEEFFPVGEVIVKADVQGAEGLLLDGGKDFFSDRVVAFYAEAQLRPMYKGQITFGELNDRLSRDFDLHLHNIYPCLRDRTGRATQFDAIWLRADVLTRMSPL